MVGLKMNIRALVTLTIMCTLLSGNTHSATNTHVQTYQVKQGDSLSSLANQFLGSSTRWREIWAVNPYIKNPDQIRPSVTLVIPNANQTQLSSSRHSLSSDLEKYRPAAEEFLAKPANLSISHRRLLVHQNQLYPINNVHENNHYTPAIIRIPYKGISQRYLAVSENQRFNTSSGVIIDTKIVLPISIIETQGHLVILDTSELPHGQLAVDLFVVPDNRQSSSSEFFGIHTPQLRSAASILRVLHNDSAGLFTIIETNPNQQLNRGALLRYRNPGTAAHDYDGILLVIESIRGAAYAALLSSKAPPMPTAQVR